MAYDNADRLIEKNYLTSAGGVHPYTPPGRWEYYANGSLCGTVNCSGFLKQVSANGSGTGQVSLSAITDFEYDLLGRMTRTVHSLDATGNQQILYGYDNAGRLEQQVYPSGRVVRNCYDDAGGISSVREHQPGAGSTPVIRTYASGTTYNPSGQLTNVVVGAVNEVRGYNGDQRLESLSLTVGGSGIWALTNYHCGDAPTTLNCGNSNGNVHRQVVQQPLTTGGAQSFDMRFTYDRLNRISGSRELNGGGNAWAQNYGYDQYGNRWVTGTMADPAWTPASASWYSGGNNKISGYDYDEAGNLRGLGTGSHAFVWDAEGRKVENTITTSTTRYFYDAEGRRVKRITADGLRTYYVYDGTGKLVAEMGGAVAGSGRPFLHADGLGSTRVVTAESGTVVARRDYFPFGEEIEAGASYSNGRESGLYGSAWTGAQRFTGKEKDQGPMEWRNDYFGARYMSSAQGRFTSPDPVNHPSGSKNPAAFLMDPQRWNVYSYVRNNPLGFVDPDGRELRIAIFNSSRYSQSTVTQAGDHIARKYREAGVKNVSVVVLDGRPGLADYLKAALTGAAGFVTGKQHSHMLEIRPDKQGSGAGSQAIPKQEAGHNFGGNSALDARQVSVNASTDKEAALGLGNIGAHEIAHDVSPFHSDAGPTDIMQPAAGLDFMFNSSLQFTPKWQRALQRRFNTSEEQKVLEKDKKNP